MKKRPGKFRTVKLEEIHLDDRSLSARVELPQATIDAYAARMEAGDKFPPPTLFGASAGGYFPGDQLRLLAARQLGRTAIKATILPGGRREALLHSIGSNADHGCPRTDADTKKAIELLLDDKQWSKWPDNRIARHCKVSQSYVSGLRKARASYCDDKIREVTRGGQTYQMDTSKIGRPPSQPVPSTEPVPVASTESVTSTAPVDSSATVTEADLMPPDDMFPGPTGWNPPPGTVTKARAVDVSKSLEQKVKRAWREEQGIKNALERTLDALAFLALDAPPAQEFAAACRKWTSDRSGREKRARLQSMLGIVREWVTSVEGDLAMEESQSA